MSWNAKYINEVALSSAHYDYEAFSNIALSEIENAKILDVGCFDGFNTILKFKPYANAAKIVGIDPNEDYIKQAKKQTDDKRFSWKCADIEAYAKEVLAEKNFAGFDFIYFSHVLQHVKDKKATLNAAFKLLKAGGFIVIKTFDDSCKISYPDPDNVMKRLFALYEKEIAPRVEHTRYTDRNNGQKCPSLLKAAGFENIEVKIHTTDTLNKNLEQRMELFERFSYFRQKTPDSLPHELANEQKKLLSAWKKLFADENYCHISNTFMVTAQKPSGEGQAFGDVKSSVTGQGFNEDLVCSGQTKHEIGQTEHSMQVTHTAKNMGQAAHTEQAAHAKECSQQVAQQESATSNQQPQAAQQQKFSIEPMKETDLGEVMNIEVNAFPQPWTPLAYVSELRYNKSAYYIVARNEKGQIIGYIGWWEALEKKLATIMHIAVKADMRNAGAGTVLLQYACSHAQKSNCMAMQLLVRSQNSAARAFYKKNRFIEIGTFPDYYSCPTEDGISMQKELCTEC